MKTLSSYFIEAKMWHLLVSLGITSSILFSGCSGNDEDTTPPLSPPVDVDGTAQLIDSEIEGVNYATTASNGVTNANGEFTYKEGDTEVTFKVGHLLLGTFALAHLNSDGKILLPELYALDRNNTVDPNALKLLRFMQSLDEDNDPSNGIYISDNTKGMIDQLLDSNTSLSSNFVDNNITALKSIMLSLGKTLKLESASRNHYKSTLVSLGITPIDNPFVTVWETTGANPDVTININTLITNPYNYTVDWGDGDVNTSVTDRITHTYSDEGNHTIKITGDYHAIIYPGSQLQLVLAWGDIQWKSFKNAFFTARSFKLTATDTPNLSEVTNMSQAFSQATSFNQNINDWDVSSITKMNGMFYGATSFNQPLNKWDVSSVMHMNDMFNNATSFNQPLNDWDISHVVNLNYMFAGNTSFNQPLDKWNLSSVIRIDYIFRNNSVFNQPLNDWNVSNIENMAGMFSENTAFNQPLDMWDVSNVITMDGMFAANTAFDQPLNMWDVSNVITMVGMFGANTAFDQPLDMWDVSNVITMVDMFALNTAFDQPLNDWDVSSVTNISEMFYQNSAFNQNINDWNVSSVTAMNLMFSKTTAFNQPLDKWNVSSVTAMIGMFNANTVFNQPLNDWNVSSVTLMAEMFYANTAFNQPLDLWDVSSVTNMVSMFNANTAFNQPLSDWNVSNVTRMPYMFYQALEFSNQDLSSWDVAKVTTSNHANFMTGSGSGNTEPNWP